MATSVSTIGAINRAPLNLSGSNSGAPVTSSAFFGTSLKKTSSKIANQRILSGNFKVAAEIEYDEEKQTSKDKWGGLAYDTSDDQQDITRGKGMVDTLFQAPMGTGTHHAVLSSYDYISAGLRQYDLDNNMDGFYIAPAFMDKVVVHITKNFDTNRLKEDDVDNVEAAGTANVESVRGVETTKGSDNHIKKSRRTNRMKKDSTWLRIMWHELSGSHCMVC